jgi:hypothetical protein
VVENLIVPEIKTNKQSTRFDTPCDVLTSFADPLFYKKLALDEHPALCTCGESPAARLGRLEPLHSLVTGFIVIGDWGAAYI